MKSNAARSLPMLVVLAMLVDCKCWEHPLYDEDHNRFDTWYLGGGNSSTRPFRRAHIDRDEVLDVELALDRTRDGGAIVRALVIDAIDPDAVRGELTIDGERIATFVAVGDGQLVAELPAIRAATPSLHASFDDGHGQGLEVVIPAPELRDALAETLAVESEP